MSLKLEAEGMTVCGKHISSVAIVGVLTCVLSINCSDPGKLTSEAYHIYRDGLKGGPWVPASWLP